MGTVRRTVAIYLLTADKLFRPTKPDDLLGKKLRSVWAERTDFSGLSVHDLLQTPDSPPSDAPLVLPVEVEDTPEIKLNSAEMDRKELWAFKVSLLEQIQYVRDFSAFMSSR